MKAQGRVLEKEFIMLQRHSQDFSIELTLYQKKKNITLGVCEIVGERSNQEDALIYDVVGYSEQLSRLKAENREFCMSLLFLMQQMNTAKNADCDSKGSCACIATGWHRKGRMHVSTSYVGDSVSFLIVLNAQGQLKHAVACNTNLHNIHNESEIIAIKNGVARQAFAFAKLNQRVGWQLALTRALGDTDYEMFGLSHAPETTLVTRRVTSTDHVFMVSTCDGAMEHLAKEPQAAFLFAKELGSLFEDAFKQKKTSAKELAEIIKNNAVEKASKDNITVVVVPFNKKSLAMTTALFDGHGGDVVSNSCKDNFTITMQNVLLIYQFLKKSENVAKMKAVVQSILAFNTEHNRLADLQQIIRNIRNEILKTPGLDVVENWLVDISHYYLAELKKLGVLSDETALPERVMPLLRVEELSLVEKKQKAILGELLIFLSKCDLTQQPSLAKINACLSKTFGKPLPVLTEIKNVCDAHGDNHKSRRIRFLSNKMPSTEDKIMKLIKELISVSLNAEGARQSRSTEAIFAALWAINGEALPLQPIARPNK